MRKQAETRQNGHCCGTKEDTDETAARDTQPEKTDSADREPVLLFSPADGDTAASGSTAETSDPQQAKTFSPRITGFLPENAAETRYLQSANAPEPMALTDGGSAAETICDPANARPSMH